MNFIFNVLLCLVACAIIMVLLVVYTAMNVFSMHKHPHLHGGVMPHPDELNKDKNHEYSQTSSSSPSPKGMVSNSPCSQAGEKET